MGKEDNRGNNRRTRAPTRSTTTSGLRAGISSAARIVAATPGPTPAPTHGPTPLSSSPTPGPTHVDITVSPTPGPTPSDDSETFSPTSGATPAPTPSPTPGPTHIDITVAPTPGPTAGTTSPTPSSTASPTVGPTPFDSPDVGILSAARLMDSPDVKCGGTIIADTTLTSDLICDCTRGVGETYAGLTVDQGASLDLGGNTVSCSNNEFIDGDTGCVIKVVGSGSTLTNGFVFGGNFGVCLDAGGSHTLRGPLKISGTGDDSLLVRSSRNLIDNIDLEDCGQGSVGNSNGDCLDIETGSNENVVTGIRIKNFGDDGIDLDGSDNEILNCRIEFGKSGSEDGIAIRGGGNQIIGNLIVDPGDDGIQVKYNSDSSGEDDCLSSSAGSNYFEDNEISGAVTGHGFYIESSNNEFVDNTVFGNAKDGFHLDTDRCGPDSASDNEFTGNTSSDNGDDGFKILGRDNVFESNTVSGNNLGKGFNDDGDGTCGSDNDVDGRSDSIPRC